MPDRIVELVELGFDQIVLRFAGMFGTANMENFADEVLPQFR